MDLSFLGAQEKYVLRLRAEYEQAGFRRFVPRRFESYDFYSKNRDFLVGSKILTFTDLNGKLMALRPDVTMSIVKSITDDADTRVYYNENVYRESLGANEFRQVPQVGLEHICHGENPDENTVVRLAAKSLELTGRPSKLLLSHMGLITELCSVTDSKETRLELLGLLKQKNAHGILALGGGFERLAKLCRTDVTEDEKLRDLIENPVSEASLESAKELAALYEDAKRGGAGVGLDFSITDDPGYYNGVVMHGYVEGVPKAVLTGGRYDMLLSRMKRPGLRGIGFAVYTDMLGRNLFEVTADD